MTPIKPSKKQILRTSAQVMAPIRCNPDVDIRYPATAEKNGWRVMHGNNPHNPGHSYGEWWLAITPRLTTRPGMQLRPQHTANLFNEHGEFSCPNYSREGFVVASPYLTLSQARDKVSSIDQSVWRAENWVESQASIARRAAEMAALQGRKQRGRKKKKGIPQRVEVILQRIRHLRAIFPPPLDEEDDVLSPGGPMLTAENDKQVRERLLQELDILEERTRALIH